MTEEQKIQVVQQMISDMSVDEETILSYLALAADRILNRVYPFGGAPGEFPPQYDWVISHSENGISRTYGSVDDEDIFATLVPYVGVI